MRIIILIATVALCAWTKPVNNFMQDFAAYDASLYDFAIAITTGGDTASTRTALIAASAELDKYDVQQELKNIGPIQQGCRWACAGEARLCLAYCGNHWTAQQFCADEYLACVAVCRNIPLLVD